MTGFIKNMKGVYYYLLAENKGKRQRWYGELEHATTPTLLLRLEVIL